MTLVQFGDFDILKFEQRAEMFKKSLLRTICSDCYGWELMNDYGDAFAYLPKYMNPCSIINITWYGVLYTCVHISHTLRVSLLVSTNSNCFVIVDSFNTLLANDVLLRQSH